MAGTWYALRSPLRRRWPSFLLLVVLLAVGGGTALAAIAGARRTVSAYPRYLRASHASDVSLDAAELTSPSTRRRLAGLPGVIHAASYQGFYAAPLAPNGKVDPAYDAEAIGSVDGRFFGQDRVVIVDGRLADPARAGELVVNRVAAQLYHYKVGQRLRFAVVSEAHLNANYAHPHIDATQPMTIVGIAKFNDEIVQDEIDRSPSVLLTPAFVRAHRSLGTYVWTGVRLRGGARAVPQLLKEAEKAKINAPFVRSAAGTTERAQRAVRPLAWSVALFGIAAGLAVIVLVGQALVRQARLGADDHAALRAIGMGPAAIGTVGVAAGVAAAVIGVLGAVAVAVALSPLSPVGPVRAAEPAPGVAVDATVLGVGAVLLLALIVVQPILATWRLQRMRGDARNIRPSRFVERVAKAGAPVPLVAGARFALEPGRGRTAVPIRTTLISAVVAMIAVATALTWGASLQSLVSQPRLYGWDWDATLYLSGGYGTGGALTSLHPVLDKDPAVQDWAGISFQSLTIGGRSVGAMGMLGGKGVVGPPVVEGRDVSGVNEILLGTRTLSELGKQVGDRVTVGTGPGRRQVEIVGRAVFPTLGVLHGDRVSLGDGALVDNRLVEAVSGVHRDASAGAFTVRFKTGADQAAAVRRVRMFGQRNPELSIDAVFTGPKRPADIVNFREMGLAPTVIAVLFGLVALGALANALVTSVRRRRRDLALLKALGLTRRQVSQAVAWQATITMVIALLIGLPLGVAVGRSLWTKFADAVGVVPRPTIPYTTLALVAVGVLAIANVIAALPGRAGSRTEATIMLRSE